MKAIFCTLTIAIILLTTSQIRAERSPWTEDYYNRAWCAEQGGIPEYRLKDGKRVDCLLDDYAVEADWANYKAYESIGQSLHYAKETKRKVGILLILKDFDGLKWVNLVKKNLKYYDIDSKVWYIIAKERFQ